MLVAQVDVGGKLLRELLGHLTSLILRALACAARGDSRLDDNDGVEEGRNDTILIHHVGVGVETEDLRVLIKGQTSDVLKSCGERALGRCVVGVELRETVIVTHDLGAEVPSEERVDSANVTIVSDTTTIVDLRDNVVQSLVRHLGLLGQEEFELHVGAIEIGSHPFVTLIPANSSILSSLKNAAWK